MKIISIKEITDKEVNLPTLVDDNTAIFISSECYGNDGFYRTGIIKKHFDEDGLKYYEFTKPAFSLSNIVDKNIFYLTYNEDGKSFKINEFNLDSHIQREIITIPLSIEKHHIYIHVIDSNYMLVGIIDRADRKFSRLYYTNLFLVDAIERTYYSVPESFVEDESIFNLMMVTKYTDNDHRDYLLLETGAITEGEKKYFWEIGSMTYHPQIETISIVDLEDYIDSIKRGIVFRGFRLINYSDRKSTFFKSPIIENDRLSLIKVDFEKNQTYSMEYNIDTGKKEILVTLDGLYKEIYKIKNEIYLVDFLDEGYKIIKENGDIVFHSEKNIRVFDIIDDTLFYSKYDINNGLRENIAFNLVTKEEKIFCEGNVTYLKDGICFKFDNQV